MNFEEVIVFVSLDPLPLTAISVINTEINLTQCFFSRRWIWREEPSMCFHAKWSIVANGDADKWTLSWSGEKDQKKSVLTCLYLLS
jgi:hypothetical protein